ncbi:unnamed protein product, partial [Rotaria magnacalcarata]
LKMPEPTPQEHVYGVSKWSDLGYSTIDMLYLRPVRWFHQNVVERLRGPAYPYYHRKFGPVKTIDQCEIQDQVCFYEAEMAFLREKRIDTMIVEILHDRLTRCIAYEGRIDALDKCAKEKDALFESHTNWYQKYGEMGVPHSCIDAYMKQKHLMIWMRRHPEVDLKGWAIEREYENKAKEYIKSIPMPMEIR